MHICIVRTYVHVHVYFYVHVYVFAYEHARMYACMYACMTYIYICICTHTCAFWAGVGQVWGELHE